MRVLQALGPGVARGLEMGAWPLDELGAFGRECFELFADVAVVRATRPGGSCLVLTTRSLSMSVEGKGLAVVRLDAARTSLLWAARPPPRGSPPRE
jgi:hypothetical protein